MKFHSIVFLFAKFWFWGDRRKAAWCPVGGLLYIHGFIVSWCDWIQQYWDTKIMMLSWSTELNRGENTELSTFWSPQKTATCKLETQMFSHWRSANRSVITISQLRVQGLLEVLLLCFYCFCYYANCSVIPILIHCLVIRGDPYDMG